jgi:hypothetical protein
VLLLQRYCQLVFLFHPFKKHKHNLIQVVLAILILWIAVIQPGDGRYVVLVLGVDNLLAAYQGVLYVKNKHSFQIK